MNPLVNAVMTAVKMRDERKQEEERAQRGEPDEDGLERRDRPPTALTYQR